MQVRDKDKKIIDSFINYSQVIRGFLTILSINYGIR